jgi:hypothetical protein
MNRKLLLSVTALILLISIFTSCKKDDNEGPDSPSSVKLNIQMKHNVSGEEVEYENIKYTNTFGNLYSVSRLQYFISDFRLIKADGSEVFIDEEHYVDGLVESTLTFVPQTEVMAGEYTSMAFIFGLSAEKNKPGRYPNPPENNMEWPPALGSGYHYMKLEGKVDSAGVINNYQAHSGPTNGNQNFIEIELPLSGFTVSGSEVNLTIKMDINNWWESPNIFDLNKMTMVMGNQEVQQKLHDNGGDVFTIEY